MSNYPPHPIVSTPEEYEEHQAAMNELCDQIETETPDPLPCDLSDWFRQGDEFWKKRFSQQA